MARSVQSAILTFGLVTIPVKLYTSASAENVKFSMITPAGNRVKQKWVDEITGEEVAQSACSKGYEHEKGQWVVFSRDEVKALEAEKNPCIEIQSFVPAGAFDALEVEKTYYLGADKGGDKGYILLSQAMGRAGRVAVARFCSRGREHLIIVKPYRGGLVMHQMFFLPEIRDFGEVMPSRTYTFHPAEEQMADRLIQSLTSTGYQAAAYQDGYVERVRQAAAQKVSGQEVQVAAAPAAPPTSDLLAALQASLEHLSPVQASASTTNPATAHPDGSV